MDQNTYPIFNQEETVCERLRRAIQATSLRSTLFTTQQNHENAAASTISSQNVSLMTRTPVNDRCARVSQQSVAPAPGDRCPRILKQTDNKHEPGAVPIVFNLQESSLRKSHKRVTVADQPSLQVPSPASVDQGKATVLPIHGIENRVPSMSHLEKSSIAESVDGMFTEYIDRAGRKIRCPTNVGARKPSMRGDSFNGKVSDFIYRAKHKFQTAPSSIDASTREEFGGKENRFK